VNINSELRIRLLLEYIRLENEGAALDLARGGNWLSDHGAAISEYGKEIEEILEAEAT